MPKWKIWALPTISTIGATTAITATKIRHRRDMSLMMSLVMRTSTTTVTGGRVRATAMSGFLMFPRDGPPIARATGPGSIPGDGLGWMMSPGAMPRSTTADGYRSKAAGAGFRARRKCGPSTRPLWSYLLVAAVEVAASAATWAGFL